MRHVCAWVVGALMLVVGGAGCAVSHAESPATTPTGPPQRGGTMVVSMSAEPAILNTWLAEGAISTTYTLTQPMNDPLVELMPSGTWEGIIAVNAPTVANGEVTTSGGGMTVHLPLHANAHWSDGVPITCADVVFTWKTVMNPANQMSNRLGWSDIDQITCPTPKLALIHFDRPYALYLSRVLSNAPLPEHVLEGKDFNTVWNNAQSVSSGPFLFGGWDRGTRVTLNRDPNYWDAGAQHLPYLDHLVFHFETDANTLKLQLLMHEADMAIIPPDTDLAKELAEIPGIHSANSNGTTVELMGMQTQGPHLRDIRVREAVAYSLDRTKLTRIVLPGQTSPAQSPIVPTLKAYADAPYAGDVPKPARVTSLMRASGYTRSGGGLWTKDGKPLVLTYVATATALPFRQRLAQLAQQELRANGIGMVIDLMSQSVLYGEVAPQGKFDLGEWSEQTGAQPEPLLLYGCAGIPVAPQYAGKNRFRLCDRQLNAQIEQADATLDPAKRAAMVRAADARIAADLPVLPLFDLPTTEAWSSRVGNVQIDLTSPPSWNAKLWWIAR